MLPKYSAIAVSCLTSIIQCILMSFAKTILPLKAVAITIDATKWFRCPISESKIAILTLAASHTRSSSCLGTPKHSINQTLT